MALCINVDSGKTGNPPAQCLNCNGGSVIVGSASVYSAAGGAAVNKVPWIVGDAVKIDGQYSCPVGAYVLLSPIEVNETANLTLKQSDPLVRSDLIDLFYLFLGVLVTVWGVKQLLKLFSGDTER